MTKARKRAFETVAVILGVFAVLFGSDLALVKEASALKDLVVSAIDAIVAGVVALVVEVTAALRPGPSDQAARGPRDPGPFQ